VHRLGEIEASLEFGSSVFMSDGSYRVLAELREWLIRNEI
jgi:hypothetical protein